MAEVKVIDDICRVFVTVQDLGICLAWEQCLSCDTVKKNIVSWFFNNFLLTEYIK